MKQHISPAMAKLQLRSTECYSWDSLLPMVYQAIMEEPPSLSTFNALPTNILGGYMFGKSCWASLSGAMISPHQLIKPGKDTVDLQCDIWWLGAYQKDYPLLDPAVPKGVGWAVQMSVLSTNLDYTQSILPTTQGLGYILSEEPPEHPMGNPRVNSVDADGHINWKYDIPTLTTEYGEDARPIVRNYPDEQWAVGYETTKVAKPADFPEIRPYGYPKYPFQFYKTPIRLVIKKNDRFTTDPTYSFRNFRGSIDNPTGIGFQIYRLNGACDGVFQQGIFGTDTHPAEFDDSPYGLSDADPDMIAPIFVGIEMKVL